MVRTRMDIAGALGASAHAVLRPNLGIHRYEAIASKRTSPGDRHQRGLPDKQLQNSISYCGNPHELGGWQDYHTS